MAKPVGSRPQTLVAAAGSGAMTVRRSISGPRHSAPASVTASRRPSTELLEVTRNHCAALPQPLHVGSS
jgi:hypothetical protein